MTIPICILDRLRDVIIAGDNNMRLCDACGSPTAYVSMGGATLCKGCSADIEAEMKQLRKDGKPVNVLHIARRMFREQVPAPGSYLLRDIPSALWQHAQHRAIDDNVSLRDLLISALYSYLKPSK